MTVPPSFEDFLLTLTARQEKLNKRFKMAKPSDSEFVKLSGRLDELDWVIGEINGH